MQQPLKPLRTGVPLWRRLYQEESCETSGSPSQGCGGKHEEGSTALLVSPESSTSSCVEDLCLEVPIDDAKPLVEVFRRRRTLVAACLAMVALGVVVGMLGEGWSFVTSLYFIVQIVTTVGYGDVTVVGEWMQVFMAVYVLLALLVVANLLNLVTKSVIETHSKALRQRMERLEFADTLANSIRDLDVVSNGEERSAVDNALVATSFLVASIAIGTIFFRFMEHCACPPHDADSSFEDGCSDETYSTCMATGGVEMSWSNALYMSVITVTTVGFGDYTPKSWEGRLFAIFWMIAGVAVTGYFISAMSALIAGEADDEALEDAGAINEGLFKAMDKDGNGFLTRSEYSRYILIKHGLVPQDIVAEIDRKFDYMDSSGTGQVTWEMVQEAALRSRHPGSTPAARGGRSQSPFCR